MIRVYYLISIIYIFFLRMLPRALSNREQGLWICLKESHHKGYIIWKSSHNEFSIFIEWNVSSPQKNHLEWFHGIYLRISWILYCWLLIWIKRCWAEVTSRRPRFWRTPAILVGDSEFSSWQRYFGSSPPRRDATVDGKNPAPVEVGSLSHYLQGFMHFRWCKIFSINSIPWHHQDDMMMTLHFQARGSQPKPSCATMASWLGGGKSKWAMTKSVVICSIYI